MNVPEINLLVIGYNRPDFIEKRLEELAEIQFSRLHVSIDASTPDDNFSHKRILDRFERLFPSAIQFSFNIHENNLGLTEHVTRSITEFLLNSPHVIVIEDDISVNNHTIQSLSCGLQILDDRKIVGTVGAYSPLNFPRILHSKNRFVKSQYFLCWGWGISKPNWDFYKSTISTYELANTLSKSKTWNKLKPNQKRIWTNRFEKVVGNPKLTWDFQMQFASFSKDMHHIIPIGSLVNNEGFSDQRATHTVNSKPKWMKDGAAPTFTVNEIATSRVLERFFDFLLSITVTGDRPAIVRLLSKSLGLIKRIHERATKKIS